MKLIMPNKDQRRERIETRATHLRVVTGGKTLEDVRLMKKLIDAPDFHMLSNGVTVWEKGALKLVPPTFIRRITKDYGDYSIWWTADEKFVAVANDESDKHELLRDQVHPDVEMIRRFLLDIKLMIKHPMVAKYLEDYPELKELLEKT
ncbi:MAG: hypothetical protein Q7S22_00780, partial [Candidatus Micrarchaeota archaeon]|nr:hypothetical protein [Candidatus Micrarchaeota archaeon]